ncbi:MAG: VCBS repeat-containing protein [Deltaproteobacteria bacterium]|nr:VCBS repeat-containing protein [Deltaproteobacteria bacterium]
MRLGGWVVFAAFALACGDDDEVTVRTDPETTTETTDTAEPDEAETDEPEDDEEADTAPEPTEPETDVIDAPTDAPLPEKMGRRLRNWLRQQHQVRSEIAAQHSTPREEGGRNVVTLLRFSPFEACVAAKEEAGTEGPAAREQCAETRDPQDWDLEPSVSLRLLMGHFTATPPRRPVGWGGAMEVPTDLLLEPSCSLAGDPVIESGDVDGDGTDEVTIRYGCSTGDSMNRGEVFAVSSDYYLRILRPDGTFQLAGLVTRSTADDTDTMNMQRQSDVRFTDENGDGNPDLVVETLEWEGSICSPDEVTFPEDDDYGNCAGSRERNVYLYVPERDAWDVPERSR